MTNAFDSTKCGLPVIPQIPEVSLQNCIVPVNFPTLLPRRGALIAPSAGVFPPDDSYRTTILNQMKLGKSTATGYQTVPIQQYTGNTATQNTLTAKTRLTPINNCDWTYSYDFQCGSSVVPDVISQPSSPILRLGILQADLPTGGITPSTAVVQLYTLINGTITADTQVAVKNFSNKLTAKAGKSVVLMTVGGCTPDYIVINVDDADAASTSSGGNTTTLSGAGCCSGCRSIAQMFGKLYPDIFYAYPIPAALGGDSYGIVQLIYVSSGHWESDDVHISCSGGSDTYFWRLSTTNPSTYDDAAGSATLYLDRNVPATHCPDLTQDLCGDPISNLYSNIAPFRFMCGNRMYLRGDNGLPTLLQDTAPKQICVYPYVTPDTSVDPNPGPAPGVDPTGTFTPFNDCWTGYYIPHHMPGRTTLPNVLFVDITPPTLPTTNTGLSLLEMNETSFAIRYNPANRTWEGRFTISWKHGVYYFPPYYVDDAHRVTFITNELQIVFGCSGFGLAGSSGVLEGVSAYVHTNSDTQPWGGYGRPATSSLRLTDRGVSSINPGNWISFLNTPTFASNGIIDMTTIVSCAYDLTVGPSYATRCFPDDFTIRIHE